MTDGNVKHKIAISLALLCWTPRAYFLLGATIANLMLLAR